jgi:uncharacterized protein YdeI (YjbR/CyaY-like superfamily)
MAPVPSAKHPDVDAYIAGAPAFARPILTRVRNAFHAGCPGLEEGLKWGTPHFSHHGLLGGMAAFQAHVGFGFWKSKLMSDPQGLFAGAPRASAMGVRIEKLSDLPTRAVLVAYVREAARLNEQGAQAPAKSKRSVTYDVPPDLAQRLAKNARAAKTFAGLAPSHRREYTEWIVEAKRDATRVRRLERAIELLEAGKEKNWKYRR